MAAEAVVAGPLDSTSAEIEETINRVSSKAAEWASLPVFVKLGLLREVMDNLKTTLSDWVTTAARGHGYDPSDPKQAHLVGEIYMKGPLTFCTYLRGVERLYASLDKHGKPPAPTSSERRSDGR